MTAILIAFGPNSLMVPCMIFKSFHEGIKHIERLTGLDLSGVIDDKYYFAVEEFVEEINDDRHKILFQVFDNKKYSDERIRVRKDESISSSEETKHMKEFYKTCFCGKKFDTREVFVDYYSGCGGVGSFTLKELKEEEFNKPLIGWDLD